MGISNIEIINSKKMKNTLFNRFKVAVWNFILPPHIRLNFHVEPTKPKEPYCKYSAILANVTETPVGSSTKESK